MSRKVKTAVLISGRGSNMQCLVDAATADDFPSEIALVLSNKADAAGLQWAQDHGIETAVVSHKDYDDREAFDAAVDARLRESDIELVCLAGFMRILSDSFVNDWRDRLINIHPSLLPAFKGLNVHERVVDTGVRLTGCSVHYVRAEMDSGPIIAQAAVPVACDDTPDDVAARVLAMEHKLYPMALSLVASGRVRIVAEKVIMDPPQKELDGFMLVPTPGDVG